MRPAEPLPFSSDLLAEALAHARRGRAVLPCHSTRKGCCTCGRQRCESPCLNNIFKLCSSQCFVMLEAHTGFDIGDLIAHWRWCSTLAVRPKPFFCLQKFLTSKQPTLVMVGLPLGSPHGKACVRVYPFRIYGKRLQKPSELRLIFFACILESEPIYGKQLSRD